MRATPHPMVATGRSLISLTGIRKVFRNGTVALDGVDLEVKRGAFLSILGPSGCGKSTLLRIIAGLTPVTAGAMESAEELEGSIGFVFQEPTLMPWANVWENVYLPLRLAHRARGDVAERIATAIREVGLEGFEGAFPRELSGGMKMRVSIARALVTDPVLLLLDEPFAALDEITRFKLNEDILRLWQQRHWTVIFVTHSVFESAFLSSEIVVMGPRPGRVVSEVPDDLPYPRGPQLRTAPEYAEFCRGLSRRLLEATT
ncbi:MAG TPA: ABC transporter ATP-binding protein [Stellaceae bacterium]|nr:ABC transporter ATP-binding protein [Stellaceae bacterium]